MVSLVRDDQVNVCWLFTSSISNGIPPLLANTVSIAGCELSKVIEEDDIVVTSGNILAP